jgi:hypothetical protein
MTMIEFRRLLALVAVGAMLVGCVPGSQVATSSPATTPVGIPSAVASASAAAVAPSFDTSTPVTIAEWDTETSAGPSGEMEALNKACLYTHLTLPTT